MIKRYFYVLIAVATIIFAPDGTVWACSGGPPPWNDWFPLLIEYSDIIVVGQYVELDDAQANGVFNVETYLMGSGSDHLLIHANDLRMIENQRNVLRFRNLCGRHTSPQLDETGDYIYFLDHQPDGSYLVVHHRYFSSSTATTLLSYGNQDHRDVTKDELIHLIMEEFDTNPVSPNSASVYPRYAPILLTTSDERHFLLPIDSNTLLEISADEIVDLRRDQYQCDTPPCAVYSPNGVDKIYLRESEADRHPTEGLLPYVESNAFGQRIVISSTSDTYALWRDEQIQIHALWYPQFGYPDQRTGSHSAELVNHIDASTSLNYPVAWKPNGRELIFSTHDGLWLWDALTIGSEPRLLIPTRDSIPVVRYVSPQGRYIAIAEGERYYNLDTVSLEKLPDGYVSPDDRVLLVFDTQTDEPTTLHVMYLAPGIRQFEYEAGVSFIHVKWTNTTHFIASVTGSSYLGCEWREFDHPLGGKTEQCVSYTVSEPFYDVNHYFSSGIEGVQQVPYFVDDIQMDKFDYDSSLGTVEASVEGDHIKIGYDIISLQSQLSAPITDLRWLSPLFYFDS